MSNKFVQSIRDITGPILVDPVGKALGSRFGHFRSKYGIHGLCDVLSESKIDILVVVAERPGRGAFKRFLAALQASAEEIRILEVWNSRLAEFLARQSFEMGLMNEGGDMVGVATWTRK